MCLPLEGYAYCRRYNNMFGVLVGPWRSSRVTSGHQGPQGPRGSRGVPGKPREILHVSAMHI